jgi:hypothetical protein
MSAGILHPRKKLTRTILLSSKSTTSPQDDRTLILAQSLSRVLINSDHLESDGCSLALVQDLDELDGILYGGGGRERTFEEFKVLLSVKKLGRVEIGYERVHG